MGYLFLCRWQLHVIAIHVTEDGVIACRCPELMAFEGYPDSLSVERLEMSVAIGLPWVGIGKTDISGGIIGIAGCTLDVFPEVMVYPYQPEDQGSDLPFEGKALEGSGDDLDAMMQSHTLIGLSLEGVQVIGLPIEREDIDIDTNELAYGIVELFDLHRTVVIDLHPLVHSSLVGGCEDGIASLLTIELHETVVIGSWHKEVDIVIPRDESLVAYRSYEASICEEIGEVVLVTEPRHIEGDVEHECSRVNRSYFFHFSTVSISHGERKVKS